MIIERRTLRWTGSFGLATITFWACELPLRLAYGVRAIDDGAVLARQLAVTKNVALARILLDQGFFVALLFFAVGLRHLVRLAHPERESAGTLVVATTVVWLALRLFADALEGGALLDAVGARPDPSVVRALVLATVFVTRGSIGLVVTATFLGAVAHATFVSGMLPRASAWVAVAGAALCLAFVPWTLLGAGAWEDALVTDLPPAIWLLSVSVWMLRRGARVLVRRPDSRPMRGPAKIRAIDAT